MLTVYFDETGHSRDPKVSVAGIAGLVAPAHRWEVFEVDWRILLSKYNLSEFHMKDFAHSTGEFRGWTEFKRQGFLKFALDIITATRGIPLGSMVDLRTYRRLDPRARNAFRDPYYMALQMCLDGALLYAEREADKIDIVFDRVQEFVKSAGTLLELAIPDHALGYRVRSYGFARASETVPLQAADLVTYELGHRLEHLAKHPLRLPRWAFTKLIEMSKGTPDMTWFRFWDADALRREEQRFLRFLEWERDTRPQRLTNTQGEKKLGQKFTPRWARSPKRKF